MQLQDRSLHKQLITLNSSIRDLKASLNETWEGDDTSNQSLEDTIDGEVLEPSNAQVSHAKQDSGILTDEESEEQNDCFDRNHSIPRRQRAQSVPAAIHLNSGFPTTELDINQNVQPTIKPMNHVNPPRTRSHTVSEIQFQRVTSMPVINEIPGDAAMNFAFSGSAFAVSGYVNRPRSVTETRGVPQQRTLSRHGSMPVISNIGRSSVRHVGSEATNKLIHKKFGSFSHVNSKKPLYKIWRSSSQVSLV